MLASFEEAAARGIAAILKKQRMKQDDEEERGKKHCDASHPYLFISSILTLRVMSAMDALLTAEHAF